MKSEYIEHKLANWGNWMRKRADNGLGYGQSPVARLMGVSARVEPGSVVPVDEVEASLTDSAIQSLPRQLRLFAQWWYVEQLPVRQCAHRAGCGTATVNVRLGEVRHGVDVWFKRRQELIEHARQMKVKN
ncbi:MAG TPA: hypothetical protein VFX23_10995 [Limnobacter sp.]|uniref:hypothetical protein n=1 Tax=Limnobacter sp. TaxID=2003368 RepID=UPI002E36175B|nr:hypothetical protein [Limnobacter sp.]HEX5486511.1 hypothetical protein [Limnobacter sp.]